MTEPEDLTAALGRMTVGELARRLGVDVGQLVLAVLQRRALPQAPSRRRRDTASTRPARPSAPRPPSRSRAPRSKRAAARPPTRRELHYAVDRWLLGELFDEEDGNVSAVARRLDTQRGPLRQRWARARGLPANAMEDRFARLGGSRRPPSKAELRALGSYQAVYDAIDRWMIEVVLEQHDGNVSTAAAHLGVSRRVIRKLRDELDTR